MLTLTSNVQNMFDTAKSPTWIVKLSLDDATRYWASETVTISGQEYVGRFVAEDGLGDIENGVDITGGGNLGFVGNCELTLNQLVNSGGLHQSFKPQSAGTELINRQVDVGMVYNLGTLATTDIVWLYSGVIDDWRIDLTTISLSIIGAREIEQLEIPQTLIDEDSYPNAPKENFGKPLPIWYGDFNTFNFYELVAFAPMICINAPLNKFVVADHVIHTFTETLYNNGQMNGYAQVWVYDGTSTIVFATRNPNDSGIATALFPPGSIIGALPIMPAYVNNVTNVANPERAIDRDIATYTTLTNNGDKIVYGFSGLPNGVQPLNVVASGSLYGQLDVHLVSAVTTGLFNVEYIDEAGTVTLIDGITAGDGTAMTQINFIPRFGNLTDLAKYQIQVRKVSATAGTAQIIIIILTFFWIIAEARFDIQQNASRRRTSGSTRGR